MLLGVARDVPTKVVMVVVMVIAIRDSGSRELERAVVGGGSLLGY